MREKVNERPHYGAYLSGWFWCADELLFVVREYRNTSKTLNLEVPMGGSGALPLICPVISNQLVDPHKYRQFMRI